MIITSGVAYLKEGDRISIQNPGGRVKENKN
jgi:hypothetical protein